MRRFGREETVNDGRMVDAADDSVVSCLSACVTAAEERLTNMVRMLGHAARLALAVHVLCSSLVRTLRSVCGVFCFFFGGGGREECVQAHFLLFGHLVQV